MELQEEVDLMRRRADFLLMELDRVERELDRLRGQQSFLLAVFAAQQDTTETVA